MIANKTNPRVKKAAPKAQLRDNDTIVSVIPARGGNGYVASSRSGRSSVIILPWQDVGATRKLAVVGGSLKALRDHVATLVRPRAKLAQGVDSHNAPHSAKAVADARRAEAKGKGKVRVEKAAKAKQPSRGGNRAYTLAGRKDESKPGTFRTYMLATIMGAKDTDSAKAKHAKSHQYPTHKLDFNWAAQQGYIKFTK